jgi:hypothetical protein
VARVCCNSPHWFNAVVLTYSNVDKYWKSYKSSRSMPNSVAIVAQSSPEPTLKYSPQYEFVPSGVGVAIGLSDRQRSTNW